ncbi:MAG: ribbon-helix-helix protein, CopG family [Methanomassiliicoccales archaeon]|nr:MAG: ribbon-helix-helix protein, CopG family [Methanomassiliicoccales archaeon]
MGLKGERITIRLHEKDLRWIDSFILEGGFASRSELLRVAAKELIDRRVALAQGQSGETYVPVSDDHINAIDYLISKGRFKSREAALFEIVRDYLEEMSWEKVEKQEEKFREIKYKMAEADMLKKEVEKNYLKH